MVRRHSSPGPEPTLALIRPWPYPCLASPSYPLTYTPSASCQARGRLARQETRRMVAGDLLGELAAKRGSCSTAKRYSPLGSARGRRPRLRRARAWRLWAARRSQKQAGHLALGHSLGCSNQPPPELPSSPPLTTQVAARTPTLQNGRRSPPTPATPPQSMCRAAHAASPTTAAPPSRPPSTDATHGGRRRSRASRSGSRSSSSHPPSEGCRVQTGLQPGASLRRWGADRRVRGLGRRRRPRVTPGHVVSRVHIYQVHISTLGQPSLFTVQTSDISLFHFFSSVVSV